MEETNRELFSRAIKEYAALGWRTIPVVVHQSPDKDGKIKRLKSPLTDWKKFQDRSPTPEEVQDWCDAPFADYAGIEIVTGRYSPQVVVTGVDFDQKDGRPDFLPYVDDLTDAMRTKTASGGFHYYFRHDVELKNAVDLFNGNKENGDTLVDFRGQGGVIVVGPTPLWSFDPRHDKTATLISRYETSCVCRPEELLPLPTRFIVAMQTKTKVGNEDWKQIFNGKIKEGTRHTVAMSLIAKLLAGVTDDTHIAGVRDLVYAILKTQFGVNPDDDIEREKIEEMFSWVFEREKKKRTEGYHTAKEHVKAAGAFKDGAAWETDLRPTHAERRGDLVTFFDKDGKAMRVPAEMYFSQATFRRCHALEYGVLLPLITAKKFEKIIVGIPVQQIVGEAVSLEEIIQGILETWTAAKEPFDDESTAKKAALRNGFASYKSGGRIKLLFPLRSLFPELLDEGQRPKRSEITDVFRSLGLGLIKTRNCNLWKYDTRPELVD